MKKFCMLVAAAVCGAVWGGAEAPSDREVWNKSLDEWQAGNVTNALETFRTLTLSRTHGARASEMAGMICYSNRWAELAKARAASEVQAETAAGNPLKRALSEGEESARLMQAAWRAAPDDARAKRNFERARAGLRELKDEAHRHEVLARAKNRAPQDLMDEAVRDARALLAEQPGALTNAAERAVAESERLAAKAGRLADALIPLKRMVLESVTNEQQAATIVGDVEATRDLTVRAAEELADMDAGAGETLAKIETAFDRYWKGVLEPPAALAEDMRAQTNAYIDAVETVNGRPWQGEALAFTRIFRAKFLQWAPRKAAEIQQKIQQGDTNAVPFTAEAQAEIAKLMEEAEKKQTEMEKAELPPEQLEICRLLARAQELMPKDPNGGQNNQQQQQQNQDRQQQQNQAKDKQNPDQDPNQDPNNDSDSDDPKQDPPKEEEKQEAAAENDPKDDKEVEDLLRKALERSNEHEEEKKTRARNVKPSPNERDW